MLIERNIIPSFKGNTVKAVVIGKGRDILLCRQKSSRLELSVQYNGCDNIEIGQTILAGYRKGDGYSGYVVKNTLLWRSTIKALAVHHLLGADGSLYISLIYQDLYKDKSSREHMVIAPSMRVYKKAFTICDGDEVPVVMNDGVIYDIETY